MNETIQKNSQKDLRFAAVDIGSNALRLHISRVHFVGKDSTPIFKRIEQVRFPLRLGTDVFSKTQLISEENEAKFVRVMYIFKELIELFEVDEYMACATSAMREARNGKDLIERVKAETGLQIEIISGDKEAEIINKSILKYVSTANFVHIDVGGGSTEINVYHDFKKIEARSFDMGSVRSLFASKKSGANDKLKDWVKEAIKPLSEPILAVGTGGNINKLYDLSGNKDLTLSLKDIERLLKELKKRSYTERINDFGLNDDRADVIVPGTEIYLKVMKAANVEQIFVPKVGLREGIIIHLYENYFLNQTT